MSFEDTKTGYDSSESEPNQTTNAGDQVDTSIYWDNAEDLGSTAASRGIDEQKVLALASTGTLEAKSDNTFQFEPKTPGLTGIQLAEQKASQSYFNSRTSGQQPQQDGNKASQGGNDGHLPDSRRNADGKTGGNPEFIPVAMPVVSPLVNLAVKGCDLTKLVDTTVRTTPILHVKLKDEASYVKWLDGVNNLLSTVGLASLSMMNKFSSFLKNSTKLTELRVGILKGVQNPNLHPKFTKAVQEIISGFYCDLIPIGEDEYSLNCRYYAMLHLYPNLERHVITTILPTVDLMIRDSLPDFRSTPDSLKILYGTVARRFISENINVIDAREEKVKRLTLAASTDPASLAKQIREEVEIINTASHQIIFCPVRQVILLYNAVRRSPDIEHYRDTLKKYRELKQVGKGTFAKFSQELHADYLREVEQPEVITRGNAAQGTGPKKEYTTPYAPPGFCFNFVKTGSCRDGSECKYKHEDPESRRRQSRPVMRERRDRNTQARGGKKDLIRAFVSALMESEGEQSDQASDQSESERGSNFSGSESGDERKAMSTRQQRKKPNLPKKKSSKQRSQSKPTTSGQRSRSSKSPDPVGSNNGKKDSKVVKPAKPQTTFQETMKNLEKKYSKVELAKIAGIFSALDLGEEVSDSVVDDQSTSPGSGSQ